MDFLGKLDETSFPDKKDFYSELYILKILLMKTIYMFKKYFKNLTLKT